MIAIKQLFIYTIKEETFLHEDSFEVNTMAYNVL